MRFEEILDEVRNIKKIVEQLSDIHSHTKSKINLDVPDKNLALYLLGGRSISLIYTSLLLLENCRISDIGSIVRMIDECVELSYMIYELDSNDPKLKKWLNNEIIAPRVSRKHHLNIFKKIFGNIDKKLEDSISDLYGGLSKYIHPTYGISKLNLNQQTLIYDYEWIDRREYNIQIFVSVSQAIIGIINMFRFCKEYYDIDSNLDSNMNDLINQLDLYEI